MFRFFSKIHLFLFFFFVIVKPSQLMRLYSRRSIAVLFDVSLFLVAQNKVYSLYTNAVLQCGAHDVEQRVCASPN